MAVGEAARAALSVVEDEVEHRRVGVAADLPVGEVEGVRRVALDDAADVLDPRARVGGVLGQPSLPERRR